jgi:hypothetical protein
LITVDTVAARRRIKAGLVEQGAATPFTIRQIAGGWRRLFWEVFDALSECWRRHMGLTLFGFLRGTYSGGALAGFRRGVDAVAAQPNATRRRSRGFG